MWICFSRKKGIDWCYLKLRFYLLHLIHIYSFSISMIRHFFFTAMLFVYGRLLSQRLVNTITSDRFLYQLVSSLFKYHMAICYFLYIAGWLYILFLSFHIMAMSLWGILISNTLLYISDSYLKCYLHFISLSIYNSMFYMHDAFLAGLLLFCIVFVFFILFLYGCW